eukprot:symbB.v1.2.018591.t1/scaffold1488.1/size115751/5
MEAPVDRIHLGHFASCRPCNCGFHPTTGDSWTLAGSSESSGRRRASASSTFGPRLSAIGIFSLVTLAARAGTKAKKKRPGLGFNMKKVSDEPLTDYDSGPKLFEILKYPHPSLRRPNEAFPARNKQ